LLQERALVTGRVVPRDLLAKALEQVPRSVKILAPLVDYHVELKNASDNDDIELVTDGETWETFKSHWIQYVQQGCSHSGNRPHEFLTRFSLFG
jgi:hypothetical protein